MYILSKNYNSSSQFSNFDYSDNVFRVNRKVSFHLIRLINTSTPTHRCWKQITKSKNARGYLDHVIPNDTNLFARYLLSGEPVRYTRMIEFDMPSTYNNLKNRHTVGCVYVMLLTIRRYTAIRRRTIVRSRPGVNTHTIPPLDFVIIPRLSKRWVSQCLDVGLMKQRSSFGVE